MHSDSLNNVNVNICNHLSPSNEISNYELLATHVYVYAAPTALWRHNNFTDLNLHMGVLSNFVNNMTFTLVSKIADNLRQCTITDWLSCQSIISKFPALFVVV